MANTSNPLTIDFSKSLGFGLYYLPLIWDYSFSHYPFAEKFYTLHETSLFCCIDEPRIMKTFLQS